MYKYLSVLLAYGLFNAIPARVSSVTEEMNFATKKNAIEKVISELDFNSYRISQLYNLCRSARLTIKGIKENKNHKFRSMVLKNQLNNFSALADNTNSANIPTLFCLLSCKEDEQERINALIRNFISTINQFKSELNGTSSSNLIIDGGQKNFAISEEKTMEEMIKLTISQFEQNLSYILLYKTSLDDDSERKIYRIIEESIQNLQIYY